MAAAATLGMVTGLHQLRAVVARQQAREAWERAPTLVAAEEVPVLAASTGARPKRWPVGSSVARLVIPRIDFDEVVVEGVGSRELAAGPGHLPGSVLPGEAGNAVISAHRDRHFRHLDRLGVGDTLVTETNARKVRWRIIRRVVIEKDARALFTAPSATLTLTTCWPVRYFGPAPDRLILTAEPVGQGDAVVAALDRATAEGQ